MDNANIRRVNNVRTPNSSNRNNVSGTVKRGGKSNWKPYNQNWRKKNSASIRECPTSILIDKNLANSNDSICSISTISVIPNNVSQPHMSFEIDQNPHQYPAWQLYFPQEKYNAVSPLVRKIKSIQDHFIRYPSQYNPAEIKEFSWFHLDVSFVLNDPKLISIWTTLNKDLIEAPESTLNIAGCAMNKLIYDKYSDSKNLILFRPRLMNFKPVVNLRSIKGNNYDRLIAIRGTVTRVGCVEVLPTWMAFICRTCNAEQAIKQPEGKITFPTKCVGSCKIRSNFIPKFYSPYSTCVAFQTIRVQEIVRGQKYDQARVPRSIDVELIQDLVDSVCPGDDITVTGILKVRPQEENFNSKQVAATFKMYIKAVAIASSKNTITTTTTSTSGMLEFNDKDMQAINMIKTEPCPFRLLVQSLCPRIFGHEIVKAGLILGLFGATESETTKKRSELHVLVVGDPGVGKSQMLQACAEISPRGIFVCGNGNSTAGLTVAVRKEKNALSSGSTLEAGALVLADQGVCCIDEFDKLSANHHALLEVMEQQVVSVAKAGVLCSLPARTSILAAANPVGGHYDRSKTVSENLKMSGPLLSRFDLVFILLDKHDKEFDSMLTEHILGFSKSTPENSFCSNYYSRDISILESEGSEHLQHRLKLKRNETMDFLPPILTQKYIAYARQNCHPKLSPEAVLELKMFYLELRATRIGMNAIPVTTRQMEALIRLTQARARIELCEIATHSHALDVISIMKFSLLDVFTTNTGDLQMERNVMGSGMSQAAQAKKFLQILQRRSSALGKRLFDYNELKEIAVQSGLSLNFSQVIDSLNNQGYLLKKGQNIYQLFQG